MVFNRLLQFFFGYFLGQSLQSRTSRLEDDRTLTGIIVHLVLPFASFPPVLLTIAGIHYISDNGFTKWVSREVIKWGAFGLLMNILAVVIMLTWGETWIVTETIIPQSIGILATLIVLVLFIVLAAYYYLGTLVYWFWGLIVTSKGAVYYLPNPVNIVTN